MKIALGKKNNYYTTIDDADWELVNNTIWELHKDKGNLYARSAKRCVGPRKFLHNVLLPKLIGVTVDHKDGNGLNNARNNLRYATPQEQARNRKEGQGMYSKGVTRHERGGKYRAQIMLAGKNLNLGDFDTELEAAVAYNNYAEASFGEFANLNKLGVQ